MSSKTIYCPECGDPSPLGQKFCEKCGTKLPEPQEISQSSNQRQNYHQKSSAPSPPTPHSYQNIPSVNSIASSLFNKNNMAYVIKEKYWDWGTGPIYDAHGHQIGKMKRQVFSIRKKIEFREMNDQIVGAIHQKLMAFKPTYTLVNENEQEIARLEKKLFTFFQPKFYLKNMQGQILMTAVGKFMGFDFNIYQGEMENPQNLVAEIHKADRWKDFFLGGMWDFADTYGVKILNPRIDRRQVLGFVIAIDNVMHDE